MTVFAEYDLDTNLHRLMVRDGRLSPMPAGPRIFRAPPFPKVAWAYGDEGEAAAACGVVQKYLDGLGQRKQTKKEIREVGA